MKKNAYTPAVLGAPATNDVTDYLGGYQYFKGFLQYFPTAEGYVEHTVVDGTSFYNYVYQYKDHLGNVRMNYAVDPADNVLKIKEENHYYPFGLKHWNYNNAEYSFQGRNAGVSLMSKPGGGGDPFPTNQFVKADYKYKYNGKEWQDELGLNMYNYGWRNYDPAIGRWVNVDPLLNDLDFAFDDSQVDDEDEDEVFKALVTKLETGDGIYNVDNLNPYGYGYNNPVSFDDPDGRCPACVIVAIFLLAPEPALAPTGRPSDGIALREAKDAKFKILASAVPIGATTNAAASILKAGARDSKTSPAKSKTLEKAKEKKTNTAKNPYGSKGKPDHQAKVKELEKKATKENPDKDIVTEKKIQVEGSKRRPDVQAVDKKTGKTTKIYEAERNPGSTRNKAREAEYDKLGIPHETHKVGN